MEVEVPLPKDTEDSRALGFRDAPKHVTTACHGYMRRITELRSFISFFFGMIKALPNVEDLTEDEKAKAKLATKKGDLLRYNYSVHRQFVNEIMLARCIESFDLYVLQLLHLAFEIQPNLLKSERPIDAETALELGSSEQIVYHLAERKIHDLSYKPLSDLEKYLKTHLGLDLFKTKEAYETAMLATEVRNLIAHNDCRVSKQFIARTDGVANQLLRDDDNKILIDDTWLRRASYTIDGVVFDLDEAASAKFGLALEDPL